MIWLARSRASRTMPSALSRAWDSSFSPSSAAASPWAILRWRSSIALRIGGQIHFIVMRMSVANTIICTTSVRLMFTVRISRRPKTGRSRSVRRLYRAEERIREGEKQREADADHRYRVQQARDQEHLHAQHRQQLRLARRAFDEAATENAEADRGAQCAHAKDDADGQHSHGLDVCNVFHSTLLHKFKKPETSKPCSAAPAAQWCSLAIDR